MLILKISRPEGFSSSLKARLQMPKMAGLILMGDHGRNHTWINGRTGTFTVWNAPDERQPEKDTKMHWNFYQDSPVESW